jgi:hypothetical protein
MTLCVAVLSFVEKLQDLTSHWPCSKIFQQPHSLLAQVPVSRMERAEMAKPVLLPHPQGAGKVRRCRATVTRRTDGSSGSQDARLSRCCHGLRRKRCGAR